MGFAGGLGVAVDAYVVENLGGRVKDSALVVLFGGWVVEGPAKAEVGGEFGREAPVVLDEVLLQVVAGAQDTGLKVDREGINLAEEEAGEAVAAGGAGGAGGGLRVGPGGGEGKAAGGIGRGDGVELVPADVGADAEVVFAAGEEDGVGELPDAGLVLREDAGGGAELSEAGEGEERQGVVEGGVGGNAGDAERGGGRAGEGGAGLVIGAAGVAEAGVVG